MTEPFPGARRSVASIKRNRVLLARHFVQNGDVAMRVFGALEVLVGEPAPCSLRGFTGAEESGLRRGHLIRKSNDQVIALRSK